MALTNLIANITLDLYDHDGARPTIKAIQLDDNTRYVLAHLTYSGADYDIPSDASVQLIIIRPDKVGAQIIGSVQEIIVSVEDDTPITINGAYAELDQSAIAVAGTLLGQFVITSGDQILRSQIFAVNNGEALDADEWAGQYDGYNLDELVERVDDAVAQLDELEEDVTELKSGLSDIINSAYVTDSASGAIAHFEDGADNVPLKSLKVNIEPVQSGSGDPSPSNIRPISGWDTVKVYRSGDNTEEATECDISLTSAGTVYGGTLDVVSGELVVDKAIVDMGTLTWTYESAIPRFYTSELANVIFQPATNYDVANAVASMYKTVSFNELYLTGKQNGTLAISSSKAISAINTNYTDANAFKTAMSGQMLVYPLATPLTCQLSAQEIKSLLGINNIWSDAGDVEVEYRANTKLYIDKRLAEVTA